MAAFFRFGRWIAWVSAGVFLLCAASPAPAQTDTLAVRDAAGTPGSRQEVPVFLTNAGTIAGLQMTLRTSSRMLTIDSIATTPRTEGMTVHWNPANGKMVMIDFSLRHTIQPGQGPILNIRCRVDAAAPPDSVRITVHDAILSDPNGKAKPVKLKEGVFGIVPRRP